MRPLAIAFILCYLAEIGETRDCTDQTPPFMDAAMWVEELSIKNIRCFESVTLRFSNGAEQPYPWVTFLSENGGGKSTALQALGLLLAGPEGAQKLLPRPVG